MMKGLLKPGLTNKTNANKATGNEISDKMFSPKKVGLRIVDVKLMAKFVLPMALLMLGVGALGEESGAVEAHETGIPRIVMFQALNFFGLMILLFFILRNRVTAHFNKRHEQLTSALREAKRVKDAADQRHQEYVVKLKQLDVESGAMLNQIRKEAEESKLRILEEAQRLAASIEQEAKKTAANEIEKAKAELYDDTLREALEGARALLTKSVADNDQRRLQKEFTANVEAVQ